MASNAHGKNGDGTECILQPILIIPGFMSSGLEVQQSTTKPSWMKKRIWINLQSLGFESLYFGDSTTAAAAKVPASKATATTIAKQNAEDDVIVDIDGDDSNKVDDVTIQEGDSQPSPGHKQHREFKSAWLQHMTLKSDMKTEKDGIEVRAIPGLEGVDYLSPGTLTNHLSYVFGPVINYLINVGGYVSPRNLQAAPYDWRLPPVELEKRDSYFTKTIKQVEHMVKSNNCLPVILLCHSLGTKTCHYFINFCLLHKGRDWIDQHIHTYMPVGGPHLGAPKAIRSVITGDKMGLDTFLSNEEALSMGRSLGSGPWLFPTCLPKNVPSCVYFRPQGVLEITVLGSVDTTRLVQKRTTFTKPNKYHLCITLIGDRNSKRQVSTKFVNANSDSVDFSSEKIYFATNQYPIRDTMKERLIQVVLYEPGISIAKKEIDDNRCNPLICCLKCITCIWICDFIYHFLKFWSCILIQSITLSADLVLSGSGASATLAISDKHFLSHSVWNGQTSTANITLKHKDDINRYEGGCCCCFCCYCCRTLVQPRTTVVKIQMQWIPYEETLKADRICSAIATPTVEPSTLRVSGDVEQGQIGDNAPSTTNPSSKAANKRIVIQRKKETYQEFSGYDIIHREGLDSILHVVKDVYDSDHVELGPRTKSSFDAPPVRRVHAIYGINLPTEVGAIYKRKDTCLSDDRIKNLYKLDTGAELASRCPQNDGYIVKNGILLETKNTKQPEEKGSERQVSGDGTVPYWSLQHVKTWQGPFCDVSVVELDKAEHRDILADGRFHKALLEYCKNNPNPYPT